MRYISYDNQANDFKILLDKGDFFKQKTLELEQATKELMKYFFIGLSLPNEKFWVNLRPDSPDNILNPDLEKTDIGRIFLEADLQLKKDTSSMTSPQTKEGREYWDKLYKRVGELFGNENITIPTITRPWIVPNEIIIREAPDNAYIYKATLKVMLEEDYLRGMKDERRGTAINYSFNDPRLKELNQYSTQLIKESIIPKLTYEVNTSKRYAPLRQVYYSLILAQWFKQKYGSSGSIRAPGNSAPVNSYINLIDSGNLSNLTSSHPYDKQSYFSQYQKSFQDGEYNLQEPVYTPMGQSIRKYVSGGIEWQNFSDTDKYYKIISQTNRYISSTSSSISGNINIPLSVKASNVSGDLTVFPDIKRGEESRVVASSGVTRMTSPSAADIKSGFFLLNEEEKEKLSMRLINLHGEMLKLVERATQISEGDEEFYTITIREQRRFIGVFMKRFKELEQRNKRVDAFEQAWDEAVHIYLDMFTKEIELLSREKFTYLEAMEDVSLKLERALKNDIPALFLCPADSLNNLNEALDIYCQVHNIPKENLVFINGTPDTDRMQIIGARVPVEERYRSFSKERFRFEKGVLYKLVELAKANTNQTYIFRLEQADALSARVRVQLNQYLLTGELQVPETGEKLILPDNLKIIASLSGGLKDSAFYDRFLRKQLAVPNEESIIDSIIKRFDLPRKLALECLNIYSELKARQPGEPFLGQFFILISYIVGRSRDENVSLDSTVWQRIIKEEKDLFLNNAFSDKPAGWNYQPKWNFDTKNKRLFIDGVELSVKAGLKDKIYEKINGLSELEHTAITSSIKEEADLTVTRDVAMALSAIARNYRYGSKVIRLEGPTGTGKTSIAQGLAKMLDIAFYGEPFHASSRQAKLLGAYRPNEKGDYSLDTDTPFLKLLKEGGVIALSELNAAVKNNIARFGWLIVPFARGDKGFAFNQYPRPRKDGEADHVLTRSNNSMIIIDINPSESYEARGELPEMLKAYTPVVWIEGKLQLKEIEAIADDFLQGKGIEEKDKEFFVSRLAFFHFSMQEKLGQDERQLSPDNPHVITIRELRRSCAAIARNYPRKSNYQNIYDAVKTYYILAFPDKKDQNFAGHMAIRLLDLVEYVLIRSDNHASASSPLLGGASAPLGRRGPPFGGVGGPLGQFGDIPIQDLPVKMRAEDKGIYYHLQEVLLHSTDPVLLSMSARFNPFDKLNKISGSRGNMKIVKFNTNFFTDDFTIFWGPVPYNQEGKNAGERDLRLGKSALVRLINEAAAAQKEDDENNVPVDQRRLFVFALENYHYLRRQIALSLNAILQERVYYSEMEKTKIPLPDNLRFFASASNEVKFELSLAEQSRWVRLYDTGTDNGRLDNSVSEIIYPDALSLTAAYKIGKDSLDESVHPQPRDEGELLIPTTELLEVESKMVNGFNEKKIVILEGGPGGGKTDIALDIAERLGLNSFLYSAYARAHIQDFIGGYTQDEKGRFILTGNRRGDGHFDIPFLETFAHGGVFIIDEGAIGMRAKALISWLTGIARGDDALVINEHPGLDEPIVLKRHPNFHLIITTNPVEETPARERLPEEVLFAAKRIEVSNKFSDAAYKAILERFHWFYSGRLSGKAVVSENLLSGIIGLQIAVHKQVQASVEEWEVDNPERHLFTLRDLRNWVKCFHYFFAEKKQDPDMAFGNAFKLVYLRQFEQGVRKALSDAIAAGLKSSFFNNDFIKVLLDEPARAGQDKKKAERLPSEAEKSMSLAEIKARREMAARDFMNKGTEIDSECRVKDDLRDIFGIGLHALLFLEPGAREREIIDSFSAKEGYEVFSLEGMPDMSELELMGGLFPILLDEERKEGREFRVKPGFLSRHLATREDLSGEDRKKLLVLHNIDALSERVRAALNNFLLKGYLELKDDSGRTKRRYLPANTHIIATLSSKSQREFSSAFFNRFIKIYAPEMSADFDGRSELLQLLINHYGLNKQESRRIIAIYFMVNRLEKSGDFWPSRREYNFTVKEALLLADFVRLAKEESKAEEKVLNEDELDRLVATEALRLYGGRVCEDEGDYKRFIEMILKRIFKHDLVRELSSEVKVEGIKIGSFSGARLPISQGGLLPQDVDPRYRLALVSQIVRTMSGILRGWQAGKMVSIMGATGTAKTTMGVFLSHLMFGPGDNYYIYSTHGESKPRDLGLLLNITPEGKFSLDAQPFLERLKKGNQVIIIDEANMRPEMLWFLNGLARGEKEITVEVPGEEPYKVAVGEKVFVLMTMNPESYAERGEIPGVLFENIMKLWAPADYHQEELNIILKDIMRSAEQKANFDYSRLAALNAAQIGLKGAVRKLTAEVLLEIIEERGHDAAIAGIPKKELRELEKELLKRKDVIDKMKAIEMAVTTSARNPGLRIVFSMRYWWGASLNGKMLCVPLYELVNPKRSMEAIIGLIIHEIRHNCFSLTQEEIEIAAGEIGSLEVIKDRTFKDLHNVFEDVRIDSMNENSLSGDKQYIQAMNGEIFGREPLSEKQQKDVLSTLPYKLHKAFLNEILYYAYHNYSHSEIFTRFPKNLRDAVDKVLKAPSESESMLFRATQGIDAMLDFESINEGIKDRDEERRSAAKASLKIVCKEIYPVYKELVEQSNKNMPEGVKGDKQLPGISGEGQPGERGESSGFGRPVFIILAPEQLQDLTHNIFQPPGAQGSSESEGIPGSGSRVPSGEGEESAGVSILPGKFMDEYELKEAKEAIEAFVEDARKERQKEMEQGEPLNLSLKEASASRKLAEGLLSFFRIPEEPDLEKSPTGWRISPIPFLLRDPEPFEEEVEILGKVDLAIGVTIDTSASMRNGGYFVPIKRMLAIMLDTFPRISSKKAECSISCITSEFDEIKGFLERFISGNLNQRYAEIIAIIDNGGVRDRFNGIHLYNAVEGIIQKYRKINKKNKIELVLTDGKDVGGDIVGYESGKDGQSVPIISERLRRKLQEAKKMGIEIIGVGFNTADTMVFDSFIQLDKNESHLVVDALLKVARHKAQRGSVPPGELRVALGLGMQRMQAEKTGASPRAVNRSTVDLLSSAVDVLTSNISGGGSGAPGGINLSALPIATKQINSLQSLSDSLLSMNFNLDLDVEWAQIQQVFNAGIRPSIQRLSEYTAAAVASPLAEDKIDQVRVMLADILRRDEENEKLTPAEESCKQLLMALENVTIH